MAQWVIGYVVGTYNSLEEIPLAVHNPANRALDLPGALRRINSGFYIADDSTLPHPLTPVKTADAAGEVQISNPLTVAGKRRIKIHLDSPCEKLVVFLFVETELDYPGAKHLITA